tara:strand:- start:176 stop:1843 length:1668 start_codon:yes stop_codon:yes gene_type:complete
MAEHNNPIEVGPVHPGAFFTKYAPVTGDIGTNSSGWAYGGTNNYPSPFRSFYQQQVNGNWYLGPYCRKEDGTSGRLKISISDHIGEIGFVQQCWYDFPRGAFDTDGNGDVYPTNKEWWETTEKVWVSVWNLMPTGGSYFNVEVAYKVKNVNDSERWSPQNSTGVFATWPSVGNYFHAALNLVGGQTNPTIIFGGFHGTCGVGSNNGTPTPNTDGGGWIPDLSMLHSGAMAGLNWILGNNSEARTLTGAIYNAMNATKQAAAGDAFSDSNRDNNFATALTTHLNEVKELIDDITDWAYTEAANEEATRNEAIKQTLELLGAAPMAGDLMIQAWWLPNLRKYGTNPDNLPTGTAANPYKWRPPDHVQERFAGYMQDNGTTGAPLGSTYGDFRDYIPGSTPNKSGTSEPDWGWYITLLNRGDTTTVPVVDSSTNEFVFHENYGFNRGGSVQSADPFLNWVEQKTDQQTANSVGALMDMSPATPFFIIGIVPILLLEEGGRAIKAEKGESIGATNLDGYDTTTFEIRISAKNVKAGNPTLYDYLLNTGDANGNKFTAVP